MSLCHKHVHFCVLLQLGLSNTALCGIKYGEGTYTAEGIKALAGAISAGSLTSLDLSRNYVGPELGIAMAEALRVNASLTNLS